jgi:hypothetical protein
LPRLLFDSCVVMEYVELGVLGERKFEEAA